MEKKGRLEEIKKVVEKVITEDLVKLEKNLSEQEKDVFRSRIFQELQDRFQSEPVSELDLETTIYLMVQDRIGDIRLRKVEDFLKKMSERKLGSCGHN